MAKEDPARAARLAEALRANLKRRKAQARASGDDAARLSDIADALGGEAKPEPEPS